MRITAIAVTALVAGTLVTTGAAQAEVMAQLALQPARPTVRPLRRTLAELLCLRLQRRSTHTALMFPLPGRGAYDGSPRARGGPIPQIALL
jgi:hypothetical protein